MELGQRGLFSHNNNSTTNNDMLISPPRLARVAGRGRLASIFLKVSDLTSRKSMTVEEFDVEINHHSAFDMMVNVLVRTIIFSNNDNNNY